MRKPQFFVTINVTGPSGFVANNVVTSILIVSGCMLTATCLTLGLLSMRSGNQRMSQLMMRGRILAQGFTVVAIVGGLSMTAARNI